MLLSLHKLPEHAMIWTCTLSKWHFWGSSRISVAAKRHLIAISVCYYHAPSHSVEVHGTFLSPQVSPQSAAISFTRGSWNLSPSADLTTVCCNHASSGFSEGSWNLPRCIKTGVLCWNLHVTAFAHSSKFTNEIFLGKFSTSSANTEWTQAPWTINLLQTNKMWRNSG